MYGENGNYGKHFNHQFLPQLSFSLRFRMKIAYLQIFILGKWENCMKGLFHPF